MAYLNLVKTVTATEFKNCAAKILKEVTTSGNSILVTRRGKPLVRVEAVKPERMAIRLGAMRGTATITGDIVGPLFPDWDPILPDEER